jgi:catechol 2,3-dioxygenase-like lactoylglutathione lyase family enzyme
MAVLDGIHHVKIPVTDLVRSRAWYERVFGLEVRMEFQDDDGVVRGVAGDAPGLGDTSLSLRQQPQAAAALAGFDPVSFGVADRAAIGEWMDRLDAVGVAHSQPIHARIGWIVSFHDPDGLELRLYSRTLD